MKNLILAGLVLVLAPMTWAQKTTEIRKNINSSEIQRGGVVNGGGGDDVALEFQRALKAAVEEAKSNPQLAQVLKKNNILDNAAKAHIVIVDDALDVKVRDLIQSSVAVNIPSEQRILINRQRWNGIKDEKIGNAIALHEALSLKKLEQTGFYPYTTQYLHLVGESESSLTTALKVNRLQQLQAAGGGDALVTLKKFFEEAREPVTAAGIAEEMTRLGEKLQCRTTITGKMSPTKLSALNIYNNNREDGPLFPEERGWRFIMGNPQDYPYATSDKWDLISLTENPTEIIQQSPDVIQNVLGPYTFTLRKNNGHITYRLSYSTALRRQIESYGYCF